METEQQIETPVTPPAKVTFTAEQQAKVEEIIKQSMGRAGGEA
jgi:hypothetical protein